MYSSPYNLQALRSGNGVPFPRTRHTTGSWVHAALVVLRRLRPNLVGINVAPRLRPEKGLLTTCFSSAF